MSQKQSTDTESQADSQKILPEMENVDFGDEPAAEESPPVDAPEVDQDQEKETKTPEKDSASFVNQEAVNKRINEITFQKYEEIRKREKIENELRQLQAKLDSYNKKRDDVKIPDMPDIYDDDYAVKMEKRDEAINKRAEARAREALKKERENEILKSKIEKQQAEINKSVDRMFSDGENAGISKDEMMEADRIVSNFIKDPGVSRYILSHEDSAVIVKYLSSSSEDLEKLGAMDPISASIHIATKIAPKAKNLKPSVTKTPDPIDIPKGKAAPNDDPYLKGVTFE